MSNEKFEMSEDLLRSVILKQAGSVLKAIQECVQNALDAEATIIKLDISQKGFSFYDNGCGMTKWQIDSFFKIFGNSSKKGQKDKIGAFGMGRGQVFSFGYTVWRTKEWKISVNIMRRLGYKIRKIKEIVDGTDICCTFFKPIESWEFGSIANKIKGYFLPLGDIKFYINGTLYKPQIVVSTILSNKDFTVFGSNAFSGHIFSQNLYVRTVNTMFDYNINCNKKMGLNFARNAFLDSEDSTKELSELIMKMEETELLAIKKFNSTSGKYILDILTQGKIDIKLFENKKMIESANGKLFSMKDLEGKEIMFGRKDKDSDKAIQQGYIVVNDVVAHLIRSLKNSGKINLRISDLRPCDVVEHGYHRQITDQVLYENKGYRSLLYYYYTCELNREVFDGKREIMVGESDNSEAWTDGDKYVCFNKNVFSRKMINTEKKLNIFQTLLHEYAHDEDDTDETDHDGNFYERYHDLMKVKNRRFGNFIHNNGIREVEREYEYSIEDIKVIAKENKINKKNKK